MGHSARQLEPDLTGTDLLNDISYLLYWDDDAIPIEGNMTLGNHLENDLMIPGEDVSDYHARIDLSERGPVVIPLGDATVSVNGRESVTPVGLILGDVLGVGQVTLQVGIEAETGADAEGWALYPSDASGGYAVEGEMTIGRAEGTDICLNDEHVSRRHARLLEKDRVVWLQDLNSANGTTINGTPLRGGARLFHGDVVGFDRQEYQLIGRGGELTPVLQSDQPLMGTNIQMPSRAPEPTQFVPSQPAPSAIAGRSADMPQLTEAGAFLLGISAQVDGDVFRLGVGETLMGRAEHCQIVLDDATVSTEHARLKVRPEGVLITNLMSANGVTINGEVVSSAHLKDGDMVGLGNIALIFREVPPTAIDTGPNSRHLWSWTLAAMAAVVALLAGLLLF